MGDRVRIREPFPCAGTRFAYAAPILRSHSAYMPRGKRTVFIVSCPDCKRRVGTARLLKQSPKGTTWKDFKPQKYCSGCRKRVNVKLKEERHSD